MTRLKTKLDAVPVYSKHRCKVFPKYLGDMPRSCIIGFKNICTV